MALTFIFIKDDLSSFFESHFSVDAAKLFQFQFFNPTYGALHGNPMDTREDGWGGEWEKANEEVDDLGYYPDGVKRTLTDEQIEIFRHSELHAFQRKKEKEEERKPMVEQVLSGFDNRESSAADTTAVDAEEGEVQGDEQDHLHVSTGNKRKRKRKGKIGNGKNKEPKPDLRKRTWDVVETGLDSLDYD